MLTDRYGNSPIIGPGDSTPGYHLTAASVDVLVGTPTGGLADIQTWQDGNFLQIQEAAATPAMDIRLGFTGVRSIRRVGASLLYEGATTHWVELRIYTPGILDFKTLWTFPVEMGYNYRYTDLPENGLDFIDENQESIIQLVHPASGNPAHDLLIDYVALIS